MNTSGLNLENTSNAKEICSLVNFAFRIEKIKRNSGLEGDKISIMRNSEIIDQELHHTLVKELKGRLDFAKSCGMHGSSYWVRGELKEDPSAQYEFAAASIRERKTVFNRVLDELI